MEAFLEYKYKFSTLSALESVKEEGIIEKRIEEINKLKEELEKYNILIKDLSLDQITYDERNKALNVAYSIIEDDDLFKLVDGNNSFVISKVLKYLPVEREILEKLRDYIILYFIILSNPIFNTLQDYLKIVESSDVMAIDEIREVKAEDNIHKGIMVHRGLINDVILTSKGEVLKIKKNEEIQIGEESIGVEFFNIRNYKLHLSVLAILVILIINLIVYRNNAVKNTVIIETTSTITLELNSESDLINVYSQTEKGRKLIEKTNLEDEHIDEALIKILEYAVSNEMTPRTGFIVRVTGKPLGYNDLVRAEKYIKEKKLKVKFNNSGDENKVSE